MKKSWFRSLSKKILITLTVLLSVVFLIGCLLPWLPSQYFWWLGFVGIAMPYLVVLMIFFILFWMIAKKKISLYLLLLFCLGYKQIPVIFAFNTNTTFKKIKANYNIRLASWNIGNMSGKPQNANIKKHSTDEIIGCLLKQNADVICLQEFEDCRNGCKSFEMLQKQYPYYYFPGWIIGPYRHKNGNVILSKYPISFSDSTRFSNGENIITADIVVNDDTISFFTTHLDSYKFSRQEFKEIDGKNAAISGSKENIKGIIKKMCHTFKMHGKQADIVNNFYNKTNHPLIFCGDLNEIANNNTYWKIRGNKQDAFLEKGFGLGKTFNSLSPVLRIDYIMPDNHFEVTQFNIIDEQLSDHSLLVTDLILKKYLDKKTQN